MLVDDSVGIRRVIMTEPTQLLPFPECHKQSLYSLLIFKKASTRKLNFELPIVIMDVTWNIDEANVDQNIYLSGTNFMNIDKNTTNIYKTFDIVFSDKCFWLHKYHLFESDSSLLIFTKYQYITEWILISEYRTENLLNINVSV